MDSPKWLNFTKTLDALVNKHKLEHKANHTSITDDSDNNRILLSDLWGDIAKCFQRAANKTIPSIVVNEDTSVQKHNHGRIRDRVAWANHNIVKDINWLRKHLHYCLKYTDQQILPQTIVDINIHIARINKKRGIQIEYVNKTWNQQWLDTAKKEYYTLNLMLKQENRKLEEEQIKDCINNRNKAIDGGEKNLSLHYLTETKEL